LKEVIMFFLEILATVPFWGAADIFFVANNENRQALKGLKKRFQSISFAHMQ